MGKTIAVMNDEKKVDKSELFAVAGDRLLNVHETAALLALVPGTVYRMAAEGRLPCTRLSKRCLRFRLSRLLKWIETKS